MRTTMYDQLTDHAPSLRTDLDHLLPDFEGAHGQSGRRRLLMAGSSGRRRLVMAGAVAAATTAIVTASFVLPNAAPGAAAVERLSATASSQPAAANGSVLHMSVTNSQQGMADRILESWTLADGSTWRRDVESDGSIVYGSFPTLSISPALVAALPTDPAALDAQVRSMVSGSLSEDEAVFTFYGDALRLGYVPPAVRSAMVTAMGQLPNITVGNSTTEAGTACLRVTYAEPLRPGLGQFYCFDEASSNIIEEGTTQNGSVTFRSTTTAYGYVAAVPANVKTEAAKAAKQDKAAQTSTSPSGIPSPVRTTK